MKMQVKRTMNITIIGAGKVGTALGMLIARSGLSFQGIFARSRHSARRAIKAIGKGKIFVSLDTLIDESDVVIIAVRDSEIGKVAEKIIKEKKHGKKAYAAKIFLHTSGSLPSSVLKDLSHFGASVGSMHPLQTIPSAMIGMDFLKGSYYCVEGQARAVSAARSIVKKIRGGSFSITAKEKDAYHLAASFLSNYVVALADMVMDLLPKGRRSRDEWMRLFVPLMEGTVKSLGARGINDALTGPITRGDTVTIARHLKVVQKCDRDLRRLHLILAQRAVKIAVEKGRITERVKRELLQLINSMERGR